MIGNLISDDFRTLCFIGQVNSSFEYDEFEFRKEIFELVNRFSNPELFYVSSLPITRATIIDYMQRDMRVFTPVAIGLCIFLLMLSFRSWTGVFLPLFVVGFSIIWTFGVMGWLDMSLDFIGTLIPVMLLPSQIIMAYILFRIILSILVTMQRLLEDKFYEKPFARLVSQFSLLV